MKATGAISMKQIFDDEVWNEARVGNCQCSCRLDG